MTVGERIKDRRKELRITQQELGDRIGITKSAVCRVERDIEQNLSMERLQNYADALETSVSYLMGWATAEINPAESIEHTELLNKYTRLTNGQKKIVMGLINNLLGEDSDN